MWGSYWWEESILGDDGTMKWYCKHCEKETEGFIVSIADTKDFFCCACKKHTEYNKKDKVTPIVIYKCGGFHDTDYKGVK